MDLRVYDLFQDPIFVFQTDRSVIYTNPIAKKWLDWPAETELRGVLLEELVTFPHSNIVTAGARIGDFSARPYQRLQVHMPQRNMTGLAQVGVQRLPLSSKDYLTVMCIRDFGFMQLLMEQADAPLDEDTSTLDPQLVANLVASDTQVLNKIPEMTITNVIENDRSASLETRCNIHILQPKMTFAADTTHISDTWVELKVHNAQVPVGAKAKIELMPTKMLRGITCDALVIKSDFYNANQLMVRFRFENLSSHASKSISEFLDKTTIRV